MIVTAEKTEREQWLAERRNYIGASDSAAAIGVSPWASPLALYLEKTGEVEPDDLSEKEFVYWGNALEAPIRDRVGELLRQEVRNDGAFVIRKSVEFPFMSATLDGIVTANHFVRDLFEEAGIEVPEGGSEGDLQIKTTSAWNGGQWQEEWPLQYQVQCQHELVVADLDWGILAVLIGGQTLKLFPFRKHGAFCEGLVNQLSQFWERVQERDPPPADGSDSTAAAIKKLYPKDDGEIVTLTSDSVLWDGEREQLKEQIKDNGKRVKELDNLLKAEIGPASIGQLPGGEAEYSFKLQKRKGYVVEANEFRVFRRKKVS